MEPASLWCLCSVASVLFGSMDISLLASSLQPLMSVVLAKSSLQNLWCILPTNNDNNSRAAPTWQCTTQTFLDDCRSHVDMFLHIENSRSNGGALFGFQPHSDTFNSVQILNCWIHVPLPYTSVQSTQTVTQTAFLFVFNWSMLPEITSCLNLKIIPVLQVRSDPHRSSKEKLWDCWSKCQSIEMDWGQLMFMALSAQMGYIVPWTYEIYCIGPRSNTR